LAAMGEARHDPQAASLAFGQRVRQHRKARGMSQDALARATNVHATMIGRLERGAREPRLSTILRVADGLAVDPGELIDGLFADDATTGVGASGRTVRAGTE
jgi:transcriptional regulator with XRE-family HTH domain